MMFGVGIGDSVLGECSGLVVDSQWQRYLLDGMRSALFRLAAKQIAFNFARASPKWMKLRLVIDIFSDIFTFHLVREPTHQGDITYYFLEFVFQKAIDNRKF
uniref:Uncharacterized protein n=1 Tax=Tolypothrix bouteillei VB521301 TaxID=1479485 RepID=A0A0C1QWZ6_9CYAN